MEALVYNRLSTDSTLLSLCPTIRPTIPTEDTTLPFIVYYRSGTEPVLNLNGVSTLSEDQLTVEIISRYFDQATNIANRVVTLLHGWSTSGIQGCFLTGRESVPEDDPDAYEHLQLTFKVFSVQG